MDITLQVEKEEAEILLLPVNGILLNSALVMLN